MRQIGMLDLKAEHERYRDEFAAAVGEVLDSCWFVNGPAVAELEAALAARTGAAHAVAVSNGSDALLCTLMALGVGPGDEVIVPTFTFFATAGCVVRAGATPLFVDVDPRTFNLDPGGVERAITDKTRAIIPVHLFGQCAEMDAINALAEPRGIAVIEDAAQAIGATYRGRQACALGTAACVSFYPTKNLGGLGEGGMIFTSDDELALAARQLRNHGESERYVHQRVGANFRLDTMKAALLLIKHRHLDECNAKRRRNAARYDELLAEAPVRTPHVPVHHVPVYHQYSILCDRRDELRTHLQGEGIGSVVYYPVPLHLQPCFASLGYKRGDLPVAEGLCGRIVSLPCHPMLSDDDVSRVAERVIAFYAPAASTAAAGRASMP